MDLTIYSWIAWGVQENGFIICYVVDTTISQIFPLPRLVFKDMQCTINTIPTKTSFTIYNTSKEYINK